jgi:monooxygenase
VALEYVDVLIVGAGLSGIGAGCHLQARCPERSYAILEALGGTRRKVDGCEIALSQTRG